MSLGSWDVGSLATPALYAASFLLAVASGLIPFVINIELYLIAVAALAHASPVPIVGLVTMGQMTAAFILHLSGMGARNLEFLRRVRLDRAAAAFEKYPRHSFAVVGFSSLTGLPPFYAVSLLSGALRLPRLQFMVIGTIGRVVRFSAVYLAPGLFHLTR
jgi:membrane protein YqaA with SNARE-associated domain